MFLHSVKTCLIIFANDDVVLQVRTANLDNQIGEGSGEQTKGDQHGREEDCPDDLDLANFMTVDSVGEDGEHCFDMGRQKRRGEIDEGRKGMEIEGVAFHKILIFSTDEEDGSEHEEITGGLEAVKAAEKEAATGDDSDDDMGDPRKRREWDEEDVAPLLDTDWDKEQPEEEEEEGSHKPMGMYYWY